jgi:hypothetical protein
MRADRFSFVVVHAGLDVPTERSAWEWWCAYKQVSKRRCDRAAECHVVGDWDMNACHDYHFSDDDFPPGPHMQAETGPKPRDPSCPPWATIFSGPAQCGGL